MQIFAALVSEHRGVGAYMGSEHVGCINHGKCFWLLDIDITQPRLQQILGCKTSDEASPAEQTFHLYDSMPCITWNHGFVHFLTVDK